jgi:hypothetical protein
MYNFSNIERIKINYYAYFRSNEVWRSILGKILQTLKESFNCKEKYENYEGGGINSEVHVDQILKH